VCAKHTHTHTHTLRYRSRRALEQKIIETERRFEAVGAGAGASITARYIMICSSGIHFIPKTENSKKRKFKKKEIQKKGNSFIRT
jgi:hypothetical protein